MPRRRFREGFRDSRRLGSLSVGAHLTWGLLKTYVDDFGLYEGDHELLRMQCHPYRLDFTGRQQFESWMRELYDSGAVISYEVDGSKYIWLPRTKEYVRSKPKYPLPPNWTSGDPEMDKDARERGLFAPRSNLDKSNTYNDSCKQLRANAPSTNTNTITNTLSDLNSYKGGVGGNLLDQAESEIDSRLGPDEDSPDQIDNSPEANRTRAIGEAIEVFTGKTGANQSGDDWRNFRTLASKFTDPANPDWPEFIDRIRKARSGGAKTFADLQSELNRQTFKERDNARATKNSGAGPSTLSPDHEKWKKYRQTKGG